MPSLEVSLEKWLIKEVKRRGGYCFKLGFIKGIPDRLIVLPGARVGFVELKTKFGRATPLQWVWLGKLKALGFKADCINSKLELIQFLNGL